MSSDLPPDDPMLADELLPPVEPPSARFIIQLFVVPAVIVIGVVLLWLLVTTLASRGAQDPEAIIDSLRSSNQARWQKAMTLANTLNNPRHKKLKENTDLAQGIAQLLDEEIDAQLTDDNSIQLRYFLCRVLGEFRVDDGLAVLLKAAREDVERDVRREAVNAVAVLAGTFNNKRPGEEQAEQQAEDDQPEDGEPEDGEPEDDEPEDDEPEEPAAEEQQDQPAGVKLEHPQLVSTLLKIASEEDDLLRSQAAFALGVLAEQPDAEPAFTKELEVLVQDLYSDARYNAALALARQGNTKAVEALLEILDREAIAICIELEEEPALQTFKRNILLRNALDAIETIMEKNPAFERTTMLVAVQKFVEEAPSWDLAGNMPDTLLDQAKKLLQKFSN